jgi:two-component system sensor histidine kinase QseC
VQGFGATLVRPFRPSLVRRLLLAQVGLLALLWLLVVVWLIYQSQHDQSELAQDQRCDMILAVADGLADRPVEQRLALAEIDRFQRNTEGIEDEPEMRMSLIVRRGGALLFASPGIPPQLRTTRPDVIEKVAAEGRHWRIRSRLSTHSGIEATLVKPADVANALLIFSVRGFVLLPLLFCLPFLILPAWLSVRLALRPWRRLAREIAARGPHDLAPLAFRAEHAELRTLADHLDALFERMRHGLAREREFVADAAHELRTPLAAMRIHAEALKGAAAPAFREELLDGIVRSSERASRLVGQLLSLMRADADAAAESGAIVDLAALVRERAAALSVLAAQQRGAQIELTLSAQTCVVGERQRLVSLIDNLIENALKYGPPDGIVSLSLVEEGDAVVFEVSDHGPGIPAELQARVFDRFFRAPDQTQAGSGLGLAIVRSVALRYGLEVSLADAAPGLRVRVRFTHTAPALPERL